MSLWFKAKATLAGFGLATGLAGMALDTPLLVWVAIGALGAALIIRLIERRRPGGVQESSTRE